MGEIVVHTGREQTPSWRGRTHLWAFALSIPAGVGLVVLADGPARRSAAAIYVLTVVGTFGISAAYHRVARSPRARALMRRIDHAMIYLLISGTYVPFCIFGLPRRWGVPLLAFVAGVAGVGVLWKLIAFDRGQVVQYALYPIIGWAVIVTGPALVRHLAPGQLALLAGGGIAYTVGSWVLWKRRPDPWPHVFGYHEVFHGLTIVAASLHFTAVASIVG